MMVNKGKISHIVRELTFIYPIFLICAPLLGAVAVKGGHHKGDVLPSTVPSLQCLFQPSPVPEQISVEARVFSTIRKEKRLKLSRPNADLQPQSILRSESWMLSVVGGDGCGTRCDDISCEGTSTTCDDFEPPEQGSYCGTMTTYYGGGKCIASTPPSSYCVEEGTCRIENDCYVSGKKCIPIGNHPYPGRC